MKTESIFYESTPEIVKAIRIREYKEAIKFHKGMIAELNFKIEQEENGNAWIAEKTARSKVDGAAKLEKQRSLYIRAVKEQVLIDGIMQDIQISNSELVGEERLANQRKYAAAVKPELDHPKLRGYELAVEKHAEEYAKERKAKAKERQKKEKELISKADQEDANAEIKHFRMPKVLV